MMFITNIYHFQTTTTYNKNKVIKKTKSHQNMVTNS